MTFDSNQRYQNSLNSKLEELKTALTHLEQVIALTDRGNKIEKANTVIVKLRALGEMLSPTDYPQWMAPVLNQLGQFVIAEESAEKSQKTIKILGKYGPQIVAHTWDYLKEENKFPVGELIADQVYRESKFPDLFDRLAQQIEDAINSGEIDSNNAIRRLQELVRLIRKNARESFFSVAYMISFGVRGIKNVIKAYGLAYLGPLGEGIQATIEEMDEDWPKLNSEIHEKVTEAYRASMPTVDLLPAPFDPLESKELIQILQKEPLRIEDLRSDPKNAST